ncbi:hypothetical protein X739_15300 [Mesorhizobium sp. LNHC220B00]|nr:MULTISPECIES: hypothetical protein [unclassified Mesorhizobium]ESY85791.1 hypothetical protein X739_15300 [Mesorhizobium sp. LNHC220B00]ESY90008.1 hypothetical protein X741_28605 [Mesorhizobium sp. LNHC229A00]
MIPHLSRPLAGPLHQRLIASSALFGAVPPQEPPIGIITSSLGAFFVVIMIV